MRVISFALKSLLLMVGLATVVALLGREGLLLWATAQVQTDLKAVRQAMNDGNYAGKCLESGSSYIEGEELAVAQLRFTSSTEYQLEIVCAGQQLTPQVFKTATLPLLVQKTPGSSGIILGEKFSGVPLEIFGRRQLVYVEGGAVKAGGDPKKVVVGDGPVSSCTGYGLSCCSLETELGEGQQVEGAQDCPRSCYTACRRRPILLSLTGDPFIDARSRSVTLLGSELLTTNYVVQPGAAPQVAVTMDFGDGVVEQSTTVSGTFTHSYQCAVASCQYTARITVVDADGVTAAEAAHNSFTVVVQR